MTDKKEEINADDSIIYIKHKNESTIYEIPASAVQHSNLLREIIDCETDKYTLDNPIVISEVNAETMPFIINYMRYYDNKLEKPPPESPIKDIHISVIFGDEYKLFSDIYSENDTLKEKIIKINSITESALYFDFKYLHKKLCAIIASLLLNIDINQIKSLLN